MNTPAQWCEVLFLHLNTKSCRPSADGQGAGLHLHIGKKFYQPVDEAYKLDVDYRVAARTTIFLQVKLSANEGPLGNSDYQIVLDATPAEGRRTFICLAYSYSYSLLGQLAMADLSGHRGTKNGGGRAGRYRHRQPAAVGRRHALLP